MAKWQTAAPWDCPRCGQKTSGFPALSRFDNDTNICSDCGTDEALREFFGNELQPVDVWPVTRTYSVNKHEVSNG